MILGAEYSFRWLRNTDNLISSNAILDIREGESPEINLRYGLNYNHRLTNSIFLKTGIRFASLGYQGIKKTDLRWGSQSDGNGGVIIDPNLPQEVQIKNSYWFIEIPLMFRYELDQKKWTPFFEAGISPHIYLTTKIKQITDLETTTEIRRNNPSSNRHLNFAFNLSFGWNYQLNENLQFFGQPILRYHLSSSYKTGPIKEHYYNIGLEFGLRKKLIQKQ